jgi:hypothetical protein
VRACVYRERERERESEEEEGELINWNVVCTVLELGENRPRKEVNLLDFVRYTDKQLIIVYVLSA